MIWQTFTLQHLDLGFSNANSNFFTIITLNPRGRVRSIFKRNIKVQA